MPPGLMTFEEARKHALADLACFDRLPPELQRYLRAAPVAISAVGILQYVRQGYSSADLIAFLDAWIEEDLAKVRKQAFGG